MIAPHARADGPDDAPAVVLGPSLGTSMDLWLPQLPTLTAGWRVLRYDLPGHGGSPPPDGPFTVADLADAVARLLDEHGVDRAAYAGVSLGGAIGLELALRVPDPEGYAACCEALALFDATGRLGGITAPTLVIAGAEDVPTPPRGHADRLVAGIPDARLTVLDGAGHLANAERPGQVTGAIAAHLDRTWKGTGR